ncbi:unnamed protein product [Calypogeia fissa]
MTDPNFYIETQRLYISYFIPSNDAHCHFLVHLYNTPEFIASIGGKLTSITTAAAARRCLDGRFRAEHARNGYGTYLVSLKSASAGISSNSNIAEMSISTSFAERLARCKPIGTVSLMRGDSVDSYTVPDVGFAILPEENGKGYATEAAPGLLEYAKRELGVDAVFGACAKGNAHSRRVLQKLGFEDRGVTKLMAFGGAKSEVWMAPGMSEDLKVYGM